MAKNKKKIGFKSYCDLMHRESAVEKVLTTSDDRKLMLSGLLMVFDEMKNLTFLWNFLQAVGVKGIAVDHQICAVITVMSLYDSEVRAAAEAVGMMWLINEVLELSEVFYEM